MTAIRCQDTVFFTTDFDRCVEDLRANQATFQTPLHVSVMSSGRRFGVPQIWVHELAVEFDEARTTRAAVVAVLAKYGCHERVPEEALSSDRSYAGSVPSNPPPNFVFGITTQLT